MPPRKAKGTAAEPDELNTQENGGVRGQVEEEEEEEVGGRRRGRVRRRRRGVAEGDTDGGQVSAAGILWRHLLRQQWEATGGVASEVASGDSVSGGGTGLDWNTGGILLDDGKSSVMTKTKNPIEKYC